MVIFCCTQVDAATRMGRMTGEGSGSPSFSQRKVSLSGAAEWMGTKVIQGYSFCDSPTRSSGLVNRVCMSTRNSPMRMGS